ncbi:LOW QUALITY PROTEIN: regulator of G-protein signaling 2-like [Cyclopterus lumpus]|uniref:LOW QUALITY PROTEIN: regulator of G-protein signaling 2-like n=1 Tax=Cyclopterus lumpus TaxID=8103 RepID=UPI001486CF56|nr:LOW QUALITY PROTEIN: regulator of G-protein signaling 2-like [Cyclopterus lumpus]
MSIEVKDRVPVVQEETLALTISKTRQSGTSGEGGQIAFWDFLKSEFCEENLEFWLACQEFETSDSPEELTRRAASIYNEFIGAESPKQVNLDYYTREIVGQSLQQPCPSCFVVAQKKIFNLMENGSFPRFTQSELYKVLLAAQKGLEDKEHWRSNAA